MSIDTIAPDYIPLPSADSYIPVEDLPPRYWMVQWPKEPTALSPERVPSPLPTRIEQVWNRLQALSRTDQSVPHMQLYSFESNPWLHTHCSLLGTIDREGFRIWDIAGNRMKNPWGEREIVVFQYPNGQEMLEYWELFRRLSLNVVDLTNPHDHQILAQRDPTRFFLYPKSGEKSAAVTDSAGSSVLHMEVISQNSPISLYEVRMGNHQFSTAVCHYPMWPDGGVISLQDLDLLVNCILGFPNENFGVHCVAATGRTATLVTAVFIKELFRSGKLKQQDFTMEWLGDFVFRLRKQRAKNWVQNPLQFGLLHDYGRFLFANQKS